MKTENLQLRIFLGMLLCFFILVYSTEGADESQSIVTFTRLGFVIEIRNDSTKPIEAQVQSEMDSVSIITQSIDEGRLSLKFAWEPNTPYHIRIDVLGFDGHYMSPFKPSAYQIRTIELDSMLSLLANLKRPAKPTTVAFSPSGNHLAIATDAGHLSVINPLTGQSIWKTHISEGYVKHATFSPDGGRFYVGEQSAEGLIYGYDLASAKPTLLWKYHTADDIGTSRPQDPNDVYAWVQYPGPYRIAVTADGDVLVAANHSWKKDGVNLKKGQLYRFDGETGQLIWKWPSDQALPMTIKWFDYSRDGKTITLVCDQGTPGMSSRFKPGTLYVIDGDTGGERWDYTFEPLKPYYKEVTFWRGVSVSPNGEFINISTDDGRGFIFNARDSDRRWKVDLTTPLEVSDVPISATAGTIGATDDFALFVTGDTFIPYHLQKGAQQPPSAHPNGLTLFAYSWAGEKVWKWGLENMPQGLRIDSTGQYAAISLSKYSRNIDEQLHGVSVFDLHAKGGGLSKYLYTYRTEGQLPYDTIDISADGGLIAVIESPIVMPDETTRGKNRVHILQ